MTRIFIFLSLLFSVITAHAQHEVQIYIPGLQFRYEETSEQSIDLRDYTHYALSYMYKGLLLGLEHNQLQDKSGSSSLGVKTQMKEWNLLVGASVFKLELKNLTADTNVEFVLFGVAGQSKAEIETTLIGQTQKSTSEPEAVAGLGGMILFRLDYFIAGLDARYMQSKAYQPNAVSVTSFKLGANFDY